MSISEATLKNLRQARQEGLISTTGREEAHSALPVLPPVPTAEGETLAIGVNRKSATPPEDLPTT